MKRKYKQPIAWSLMTVVVALILSGIMIVRLDRLANSVMWIADAIIFFVMLPMTAVALYYWVGSTMHRWLRRKLRRRPKPIPISQGRKEMQRKLRRKSG